MEYNIVINGFQEYFDENGDNSKIELKSEAEFTQKDGKYYIEYDEELITDCENSHTQIEIGDDFVAMHRTGAVKSEMLFINDKRTGSLYQTPFGQLHINIYTTKLYKNIDENGGNISIEYIIDADNKKLSKNSFDIELKKSNI